MNDFYQELTQSIKTIQNSANYNTRLEKAEEELTKTKNEFEKKQDQLSEALAYITVDLKNVVKIKAITKSGAGGRA